MIRLGGSDAPVVIRLGAGMPETKEVSHVASWLRRIIPKEIPLEGPLTPAETLSQRACASGRGRVADGLQVLVLQRVHDSHWVCVEQAIDGRCYFKALIPRRGAAFARCVARRRAD